MALKFDALSAYPDSGINHLNGFVVIPFMIYSDFSNDKRGMAIAYFAAIDLNFFHYILLK
jgi:hypothetical protein